ncbi:MAG: MoaD/ThiS family protein [Desulfobacteraceae bacterium]
MKLFGLLGRGFPDYDHEKGMVVQLPEGATVKDLLVRLEISKNEDAVVTVKGLVQRTERTLKHRDLVYIFQSVAGG